MWWTVPTVQLLHDTRLNGALQVSNQNQAMGLASEVTNPEQTIRPAIVERLAGKPV